MGKPANRVCSGGRGDAHQPLASAIHRKGSPEETPEGDDWEVLRVDMLAPPLRAVKSHIYYKNIHTVIQ
jgi:hypothetical protein